MSVHISLILEASEMFLSLHMIFSLERAVVVRAILERISGFDPSLEMIASSSLSPIILISLWKPFGLLSSLLSCLGRFPFCTIWWLYRDGLGYILLNFHECLPRLFRGEVYIVTEMTSPVNHEC